MRRLRAGVAGFHDWTLDGLHLCTTRLELLELNTMGPADHAVLTDVESLRRLDGTALRKLGRLAHPTRRRRGEQGFSRITWEEALGVLTDAIQWGGRHLCSDGRFPTPSGRGSFSVVDVPGTQVPEGNVLLPQDAEHREPTAAIPDYQALVRIEVC